MIAAYGWQCVCAFKSFGMSELSGNDVSVYKVFSCSLWLHLVIAYCQYIEYEYCVHNSCEPRRYHAVYLIFLLDISTPGDLTSYYNTA